MIRLNTDLMKKRLDETMELVRVCQQPRQERTDINGDNKQKEA